MADYGFDELRTLCQEIRARTEDGRSPPDLDGRSPTEVHRLLMEINEAALVLTELAQNIFCGGRVVLSVLTGDEAEKRQGLDLSAPTPATAAR